MKKGERLHNSGTAKAEAKTWCKGRETTSWPHIEVAVKMKHNRETRERLMLRQAGKRSEAKVNGERERKQFWSLRTSGMESKNECI